MFTDPNKELDMENDKLMSMLSRLFFFGALVLAGLGFKVSAARRKVADDFVQAQGRLLAMFRHAA